MGAVRREWGGAGSGPCWVVEPTAEQDWGGAWAEVCWGYPQRGSHPSRTNGSGEHSAATPPMASPPAPGARGPAGRHTPSVGGMGPSCSRSSCRPGASVAGCGLGPPPPPASLPAASWVEALAVGVSGVWAWHRLPPEGGHLCPESERPGSPTQLPGAISLLLAALGLPRGE